MIFIPIADPNPTTRKNEQPWLSLKCWDFQACKHSVGKTNICNTPSIFYTASYCLSIGLEQKFVALFYMSAQYLCLSDELAH